MRLSYWAGLLGTALVFAGAPAQAAWHAYYIKVSGGFSFTAPGDMKADKITYTSAMAGPHKAVVFTSNEDDVDYKITIVDFTGRGSDESALIKEATATSQDKTKIIMDEEA